MPFPGEGALREERRQIVATVESLSDHEFEHGTTLCSGWAPRDVLAHLLGEETRFGDYIRALGNTRRGNARMVAAYRSVPRAAMEAEARRWADRPTLLSRTAALFWLGDNAMHHQDVLRGLDRRREIPDASAEAIYREGALVLGSPRLLRYRAVPSDGGFTAGRGRTVTGTREALGLWLADRRSVADELTFH